MTRSDRPDAKLARDQLARVVAAVCGVVLFALGIFFEATGRLPIVGTAFFVFGGAFAGSLIVSWWLHRPKRNG